MTRFTFAIAATDGAARTGTIAMQRGEIRTPAFMPVGTAATVKAMKPGDVRASGADIILGNTYHLMLRPGAERVARLGGLHNFMGWERPILTDSGGYQVMSLSELTKTSEEGVSFKSHLDGSTHMLTPERSVEVQRFLGSDIVMAFDQLVATTSRAKEQRDAMERSMRWAKRSKEEFDRAGDHAESAAIFGIQQGALDEKLRRASARLPKGGYRRRMVFQRPCTRMPLGWLSVRKPSTPWKRGSPRGASESRLCRPRIARRLFARVSKPAVCRHDGLGTRKFSRSVHFPGNRWRRL